MRKSLFVTAIASLATGFVAGYITYAQLNWQSNRDGASTGAASSTAPGGVDPAAQTQNLSARQGLPEGHPPIDPATVIKQLEDLVARNPKDPTLPLKLGNYFSDQRQYLQAIPWYLRTLELNPKNINARTDLGTAYFYTGRPQDTLREYRRSLEIDPGHENTLVNTILINLESSHDLAAAQQAWDQLRRAHPRSSALDVLKKKIDAGRTSNKQIPSPK